MFSHGILSETISTLHHSHTKTYSIASMNRLLHELYTLVFMLVEWKQECIPHFDHVIEN